ncbi:cold shock domain-containing protein [Hymenobacter sp. YC55]|uniref:cold-shock protein n=1 Tax=Hymenobacter sp. YC55 TaxID=3034019 RepID=UPI0023F6C706|nr:cold shock domain-containing protein [Hymenobacter sp. YC55]MDF7812852.1 cold shock domain-containing protein [Hymenobacter sp. YC55]
MKGIIVKYIEDKGFGFIKDENEDTRFFHIKNIKESKLFLNNLTDYYYTDWLERKCYVVSFKPSQTEKGLNALDISLTQQIFNNPEEKEFEAKIIDIKYNTDSLTRIVSGISKGMSAPFGATAGGNGTYRIDYPEVLRELNIYFRRVDDIGWGTIEVREIALSINNRSKITSKLIENIRHKIIGKNITVYNKSNKFEIDDNYILILP